MNVTRDKNCYCHTCDKYFHYLGIARHRASHRDKKENCKITFTNEDTYFWDYNKEKKMKDKRGLIYCDICGRQIIKRNDNTVCKQYINNEGAIRTDVNTYICRLCKQDPLVREQEGLNNV